MENKKITNNIKEAITCLEIVERELKDYNDLTNIVRGIVDDIEYLKEEIKRK